MYYGGQTVNHHAVHKRGEDGVQECRKRYGNRNLLPVPGRSRLGGWGPDKVMDLRPCYPNICKTQEEAGPPGEKGGAEDPTDRSSSH